MRKSFIIAMALVLLAAAGASAAPFTFNVVGVNNAGISASVTLDYQSTGADTAMASMFITNTSSILSAKLNNVAFSVPSVMNLVGSTGGVDGTGGQVAFQQPGTGFLYQPNILTSRNTVTTPLLPGYAWDLSIGTESSFASGGYDDGLGRGASAGFTLDLYGPGIGGLSTGAILAALQAEFGKDYGRYFAATFGYAMPDGEFITNVTEVATPTPVPGAVWLLGSGLVGILGFKRRRKDA